MIASQSILLTFDSSQKHPACQYDPRVEPTTLSTCNCQPLNDWIHLLSVLDRTTTIVASEVEDLWDQDVGEGNEPSN